MMIRSICIGLLCFLGFVGTQTYAKTPQIHNLTLTPLDFSIPPNEPQVYQSPFVWTYTAYCIVLSEAQTNPLTFKILKKKVSIDNIEFIEGESLSIDAYPGQKFDLIADSRAKIEIINHGTNTITLRCGAKE